MFYLTCTIISRVDFADYGVSRAKDWVSVDCGTTIYISKFIKIIDMPSKFSGP